MPDATSDFEIDVYYKPSANNGADLLAGFQLLLSIEGPDEQLQFVDAGRPDARPYVFPTNSVGPLFAISPNGQEIQVGDFLDQGQLTAQEGDGLVTLRLAPVGSAADLAAEYSIRVLDLGGQSFLAADANQFLPLEAVPGRISRVPEPGGGLLAAGGLCLAWWSRKRIRRR